ncbi:transposase [Chryseobacterium jejuense]|uniref:transposase n=1 Tax=Chryseobacterium jejuense TaxID=445960 RepID=UPI001AE9A871|nr:transposase [Chryseobacterium jejuense]MBP2617106.1 putative transposase [Chryseobacterium jejuense]
MKKSKYSENQVFGILKEQEHGKSVIEICREHGITQGTFYRWKSKYSGIESFDI